jgi:hypothetical protein
MFYEFNQNNSGGSFMVDDKVCHRLIIEADSEDEATNKAIDLGVYFNGCEEGSDCSCCGDRWYGCNELTFPKEYSSFPKEEAEELASTYGAEVYAIKYEKGRTPYTNWKGLVSDHGVLFKTPESYAQYLADEYGWTTPDIRIFYKDKTIVEINSRKKK